MRYSDLARSRSFAKLIVMSAVVFVCNLCSGQSRKPAWHEFAYPADGFALTLPYSPQPHDSPAVPDAVVYAVQLPDNDATLALRVTQHPRDCVPLLAQMKSGVLSGRAKAVPNSLKDVSVEGHPGIEYEWQLTAERAILERWYCVDQHLYIFGVNFVTAKGLPASAKRILDSFRLVDRSRN